MEKTISQLSEKCQKCPYINECDEKRMIACGMMKFPAKMSNSASSDMTMPNSAEMLVRHSYRNIKISPTQTITVDLEEIKKDLEKRFYKAIGCPSLEFGA